MAALGPAAGQHIAATRGGHAGAETVHALAVQIARLEGTFHDRVRKNDGIKRGIVPVDAHICKRKPTRLSTSINKLWITCAQTATLTRLLN